MMNREQWLQAAVAALRPIFLGQHFTVPELYVSCGFPSKNALGKQKRSIGECWSGLCSADNKPQLFISPLLALPATEQGVLATLVHEMVHATIGTEAAHGPKFRAAMKKIGLTGKPTATVAGELLIVKLEEVAATLGEYPHSELKIIKERKKQTTRMHKAECPGCGYTVRLSKKWANVGVPACPSVGHGLLQLDQPLDDGGDEGENE